MKTRAVIFDLYGVLGLNAWQQFKTEHFGSKPERWQALRRLGEEVDAGKASNQQFVSAVAQAAEVSEAEVRQKFEETAPNRQLLGWIEDELRGVYKIGLLSNASRDVLHTIFTASDRQLFDAAITSFHVGLTKPDPAIYQLICDELGVEPDECIVVDDQSRHLETADKLGMKTILYTTNEQVESDVERLLKSD